MAHSSRPHPYRATSRVDTPQGPRTAAWLAGHRGLPGDVNPPPYRPILILVDYSPLQGLTHRSEPDRDLYMALANSNFKNVSAGELEALFTWSRQLEPIEAGILPIRDLRTAITTRLRTQWDIHLEPSNLEFRYCDLEGDAFQVPNDWTVMQLLEEYRPDWRLRQYNYIESTLLVPGTSQPFVLRLRCHKVTPGVILICFAVEQEKDWSALLLFGFTRFYHYGRLSGSALFDSWSAIFFFVNFVTRLLLLFLCLACMCDLSFWFGIELILRPFHSWSINVTQRWLAWVGLQIRTVDPLPQSLPQSQAAGLLNYVIRLPPLLRPRPLRHIWKLILHPTTSAPRLRTIHIQHPQFLMYLSLQSQALPTISSSAPTSHHEWSTRSTSRSLRTPTTPGSYSLKRFPPRGSPNVVILNITSTVSLAIGSGPCALRIIGAITLRFL